MIQTTLACVLLLAVGSLAGGPASKMLSGPPSEFPNHELPMADSNGVSADSAAYFIVFEDATNPVWTRTINIDATQFGLAVYSPLLSHLEVALFDPNGDAVDLSSAATEVDFPVADDNAVNQKLTGLFYALTARETGDYKLRVSSSSLKGDELAALMLERTGRSVRDDALAKQGMVFLYNDSPDYIFTHVTDYQTVTGKSLGLATRMFDNAEFQRSNSSSYPPRASSIGKVSSANMEVVFPDGHIESVPMRDDGLNNDGLANDGVYAALFTPLQPGQYVMQASLSGSLANTDFIRTTQHFVQVVDQVVALTGSAFATLHTLEERVALHFEVKTSGRTQGQRFRIYAEVYGTSHRTQGTEPVAWVSTIAEVTRVRGRHVLSAEIDLAWFAKAGAEAPISMKNAYIQEISSMVPISFEADLVTFMPPRVREHVHTTVAAILARGYQGEISTVMRQGVPPLHLQQQSNATNGNAKLIVVHGYCAQKNPFAVYPEDWTDAMFYSDPGKGIGIDEFARNVLQFIEDNSVTSFGLVGHSQGGMVSLHILNYYHTGLDIAHGKRKIQSLASPFMGNSAAGSADNIKKIFGIGCNTVNDLTIDGATAWLSGITTETIAQLNYYTTQYDKGGLFGNGWCNMLMNTQLDNPNDGATELSRARLNGAINRGHTVGQCHIDGMKWPASYWDHARNAEMNASAAR